MCVYIFGKGLQDLGIIYILNIIGNVIPVYIFFRKLKKNCCLPQNVANEEEERFQKHSAYITG